MRIIDAIEIKMQLKQFPQAIFSAIYYGNNRFNAKKN
jgi:hypothetical protein